MKTTNHEKVFDTIIEARMHSDTWDNQIAHRVIGRRKKRQYAAVSTCVASSMAAAAIIIFAILPGFRNSAQEVEGLNNLINAQIAGTRQDALAGVIINRNYDIQHVDAQYDESLDDLIDDTLVQRL
jgi:hypothetical protein